MVFIELKHHKYMTLHTEILAVAEFTVIHLCSPKGRWSLWFKIIENVISNVYNPLSAWI